MIVISGIFGYIGNEPCNEIIFNSIQKLRHRGFDICGMAVQSDNTLMQYNLNCNEINTVPPEIKEGANIGIAGCGVLKRQGQLLAQSKPAVNNLYAAVVDGYIENYNQLKKWCKSPFTINSDDSLVLAILSVTANDDTSDKTEQMKMLSSMLDGSASVVFINSNQKAIYCIAKDKPLLVGVAKTGFYISSEVYALMGVAEKYFALSRGEISKITNEKAYVYDSRMRKIKKSLKDVPKESCDFEYTKLSEQLFMYPSIIRDVSERYIKNDRINMDFLKISSRYIDKLNSIILTGSGKSYNIAAIIRCQLENMVDIPVICTPAGELKYNGSLINENTLVIAFSHSGESSDTISAVSRSKSFSARVISISCGEYSTLSRISDSTLVPCNIRGDSDAFLSVGAMYFCASLLSLYISKKSGIAKDLYLSVILKMADMLSGKILASTKSVSALSGLCSKLVKNSHIIFTGMGADYPLCREAAQTLSSICSIKANYYPLCQLLSVYNTFPVGDLLVVPITNKALVKTIMPYLLRAQALGVEILIVTLSDIEETITDFDNIISFNDSVPLFNPLIILSAIYKAAAIIWEANNSSRIDDAI